MPVDTLVLKLVFTPALIGIASLAARRWGQTVGGWFVGLPLTSGPIALFLALERGASFAEAAAIGSLAGAIAEAAFCVAYARVAARGPWPAAFVAGSLAFAVVAAVLQRSTFSLLVQALAVCASLAIALRLLPSGGTVAATGPPPRWELPARMASATVVVLLITGFAGALGPRLSGILATYPVYAVILTVFAHRTGTAPAVQVLRGLLLGLFAFVAFFVILGASIERVGIATAFGLAIAGALAVQAASLALLVGGLGGRPEPPNC